MKRDVHIIVDQQQFIVTTAGIEEASFTDLGDAERFGRNIAKEEKSKFFVHCPDGNVTKRESYNPADL